jgi:PhnB protein
MHVALKLGENLTLMGTDALESMGQKLTVGNNFSISLHPTAKADADKLYADLSQGGTATMPMQEMFWGAYYGMLTDKFGVQWMINCEEGK